MPPLVILLYHVAPQKFMVTKERLTNTDELEESILELLKTDSPPDKVESIFLALRKKKTVYKHEVARSIWRLTDQGLIAVRSGRVISK